MFDSDGIPILKKQKRPANEQESQKRKMDNIIRQQKSEDTQLKEMWFNKEGWWETSYSLGATQGIGLKKFNELSRRQKSPIRDTEP